MTIREITDTAFSDHGFTQREIEVMKSKFPANVEWDKDVEAIPPLSAAATAEAMIAFIRNLCRTQHEIWLKNQALEQVKKLTRMKNQ